MADKRPGWSLKGCNGDETAIRERCRVMGLKDLEELQARLEDAISNQLLAANHEAFKKALAIATEVLEKRHAAMREGQRLGIIGRW